MGWPPGYLMVPKVEYDMITIENSSITLKMYFFVFDCFVMNGIALFERIFPGKVA